MVFYLTNCYKKFLFAMIVRFIRIIKFQVNYDCSSSSEAYRSNTLPPLPAQRNLMPPPTFYPQQPVAISDSFDHQRFTTSEISNTSSKRSDINVWLPPCMYLKMSNCACYCFVIWKIERFCNSLFTYIKMSTFNYN